MSVENIVPQWAETDQNELTDTECMVKRLKNLRSLSFPFMYLHVNSDGTVAGCTLDWARGSSC